MANQHAVLEGFGPVESLEALATLAQRMPDEIRALMDVLLVRVDQPRFASEDPGVAFAVLNQGRRRASNAVDDAFTALSELLNAPGTSRLLEPSAERFYPLPQALGDLVLSFLHEDHAATERPDRFGDPLLDESLFVVLDASLEDLAILLDAASQFGTQARLATGTLPFQSATANIQPSRVTFFWVKDDPDRLSWFSADLFRNSPRLRLTPFAWAGRTLLFAYDGNRVPYIRALPALTTLLDVDPVLFNATKLQDDVQVLGAAFEMSQYGSTALVYLGGSRFSSDFVQPPSDEIALARAPSVELLALKTDFDLVRTIQDEVDRQEGYRLHLRPTRLRENDITELEALRLELLEIQEEISTLEGMQLERHDLYCFEQVQLEALVATLATISPSDLKAGGVRYGFFAPTTGLPGRHYLLIERSITRIELERLIFWNDPASRPIKFWMEPRWAETYQADSRSRVFVPEGTLLIPDLHSWGYQTMDAYLREAAGTWLHGRLFTQKLPDNPLYIFEPDGQRLRLSVLDDADFRPIADPQVVGWLNDSLTVLHKSGDVEAFVALLSDARRREATRDQAQHELAELERALEAQASQAVSVVAAHTGHILDTLARELTTLEKTTAELVEQARKLNANLALLDRLYTVTHTAAEPVKRSASAATKEMEALGGNVAKLVQEAQTTINTSVEARANIEDEVRAEITRLTTVRNRVNELLDELLK